MGKLERKIVKGREERGGEWDSLLQARIRVLEAQVEKLTHALDSDVKVIKEAGDVIQRLGEENAKMARSLKARGIMTLDGRFTTSQ